MIDLVGLLGTLPGPLLLGVVSIMLAAESGLLIGVVLPCSTVLLSLGLLVSLGVVPLAAAGAARLVGGLRTIVPRVAGGMDLSYRRVAVGDVAAAALWAPSLVLLGHFAGSAFDQIRTLTALVGPPLVLFLLLVWGGVTAWQRLARSHPLSMRRGGQVLHET